MRSVLCQGHSQNLRDLLLNYGLDRPDCRIVDFTFGTGSMWKTDYAYKFELTRTDAVPTREDVIKKDLLSSDYSDLGMHDAAIFDPPYLYGHSAFDYSMNNRKDIEAKNNNSQLIVSAQLQGKNSWGQTGDLKRFTGNKDEREFIDRVKGVNRAALTKIKLSFFMHCSRSWNTMNGGYQMPNHIHCIQNLTNFKLYATFPYLAGGAKTWKSHCETSHGFWIVLKLQKDKDQTALFESEEPDEE